MTSRSLQERQLLEYVDCIFSERFQQVLNTLNIEDVKIPGKDPTAKRKNFQDDFGENALCQHSVNIK